MVINGINIINSNLDNNVLIVTENLIKNVLKDILIFENQNFNN